MTPFSIHTPQDAPEDSVDHLKATLNDFGMIPNLEGVMAQAPALLATYVSAWELFGKTAFSPIEQQVVYQTANFENNCEYCVPWHSLFSEKAGMTAEDVAALREGAALSDPKLEALRRFAQSMVRVNGNVAPSDLQAFFDAGYTQRHALEVVLGLAIKTMSNFTNSIAQTSLDGAVEKYRWKKPTLKGAS